MNRNHLVYNPSAMTIKSSNPPSLRPSNQIFRNLGPPNNMSQPQPHPQQSQFGHFVISRATFHPPPQPQVRQQRPTMFKVPSGLTDRIATIQQFGSMQVTPIYAPQSGQFQHLKQQQAMNMPSVSSMISPPMENVSPIPNWRQGNKFIHPGMEKSREGQAQFFTSFLDERATETPAPIPIECQLGPETPSPSLPSTPPSDGQFCDTSELLRMTFAEDFEEKSFEASKKRKLSEEEDDDEDYTPYQRSAKRYRRTKAQMNAARFEELLRMMKPCVVSIQPLPPTLKPVRIFRGETVVIMREGMPRVRKMKCVPREIIRIVNIGFSKNAHGLAMSCCMRNCRFKNYASEKFLRHLMGHETGPENGVLAGDCFLCGKHFDGTSLTAEFRHMVLEHIVPFIRRASTHEILYSYIKTGPSSLNEESDYDSDQSPLLTPSETDALEQEKDAVGFSQLDENAQSELLGVLDEIDFLCSPVMPEKPVDESDTDFDPNAEVESEDEPVPDEDVTSAEENGLLDETEDEMEDKSTTEAESDKTAVSPVKATRSRTKTLKSSQKTQKKKSKRKRKTRSRSVSRKRSLSKEDRIILKISANTSTEEPKSEIIKKKKDRTDSQGKNFVDEENEENSMEGGEVDGNSELETDKNTSEQEKINKEATNEDSMENQKESNSSVDNEAAKVNELEETDFLSRPSSTMQKIKQAKENPEKSEKVKIMSFEKVPESIEEHEPSEETPTESTIDIPPENANTSDQTDQSSLDAATCTNKQQESNSEFVKPTARKSTSNGLKPKRRRRKSRFTAVKRKSPATEPLELYQQVVADDLPQCHVSLTRCETAENGRIILKLSRLIQKKSSEIEKTVGNSENSEENKKSSEDSENKSGNSEKKSENSEGNSENAEKNSENSRKTSESTNSDKNSTDRTNTPTPQPCDKKNRKNSRKDEDEDVFYDSVETFELQLPETPPTSEDSAQEKIASDVEEEFHSQPETEEACNIVDIYPLMDPEDFKRWVKSKSCLAKLLTEDLQFATYKCMSIQCSFFTDDKSQFAEHLKTHEGSDKFFLCSVCLLEETNPADLLEHIEENHEYDRYQCGKCMYRASEKFYCDLHRKKFHKNETVAILKINRILTKTQRIQERRRLEKLVDDHVEPIKCKFCTKSFFIMQDYREHLQAESDASSSDIEKLSKICTAIAEIQEKESEEICEFGELRCIYCKDGFNDFNLMQEHLAEVHPSKMGFICKIEKKYTFIDVENPKNSVAKYAHLKDIVDPKAANNKKILIKMNKKTGISNPTAARAPSPTKKSKEPEKKSLLIIESAYSLSENDK